jgi:hypothetical protein
MRVMKQSEELSAQDAIRQGVDIPRYAYRLVDCLKDNFGEDARKMQDDGWDLFQFVHIGTMVVTIAFRKRVN